MAALRAGRLQPAVPDSRPLRTFDAAETVDDAFFKRRIATAVARRAALPELAGQEGLRLVHAESMACPGDRRPLRRHGGGPAHSAGADKWRSAIVAGPGQGHRL